MQLHRKGFPETGYWVEIPEREGELRPGGDLAWDPLPKPSLRSCAAWHTREVTLPPACEGFVYVSIFISVRELGLDTEEAVALEHQPQSHTRRGCTGLKDAQQGKDTVGVGSLGGSFLSGAGASQGRRAGTCAGNRGPARLQPSVCA